MDSDFLDSGFLDSGPWDSGPIRSNFISQAFRAPLGFQMQKAHAQGPSPVESGAESGHEGLHISQQYHHQIDAIAIGPEHAFIAKGARIEVWNLKQSSTPLANIATASFYLDMDSESNSEVLVTDMVYGQGQLYIATYSNPPAGTFQAQANPVKLHILQLNAKTELELQSSYELESSRPIIQMILDGTRLWLSATIGGLYVLDFGLNPQNPRLHHIDQPLLQFDIRNGLAFIAEGQSWYVLDAIDPESETVHARFEMPAIGITRLNDHRIAIRPPAPQIEVYEWSRTSPEDLGLQQVFGGHGHVQRVDNMFLVPGLRSVASYALTPEGSLSQVSEIPFFTDMGPSNFIRLDAIKTSGSNLIIGSKRAGFEVRNIGHAVTSPPLLSSRAPSLVDIAIDDHLLHAADGSGSYMIFDIEEAERPRPIMRASLPNPKHIFIDSEAKLAYVACGRTGVFIIDFSRPHEAQILSNFKTPDEAADILVHAGRAYVASGRAGLRVFDVSDPATPHYVSDVGWIEERQSTVFDLAIYQPEIDAEEEVRPAYLMAAASRDGFLIFKLEDLDHPQLLSQVRGPDTPIRVGVRGDQAFLGYSGRGVRSFDLKEIERPRLLSFYRARSLYEMQVSETTAPDADILIGFGSGILEVIDLDSEQNLVRTKSSFGRVQIRGAGAEGPAQAQGRHIFVPSSRGITILESRPSHSIWLPLTLGAKR